MNPDFGTGKPIVVRRDRYAHIGPPIRCYVWECEHCGLGENADSWQAAMEAAHQHACDGIRLAHLKRRINELRENLGANRRRLHGERRIYRAAENYLGVEYCAGRVFSYVIAEGRLAAILAEVTASQIALEMDHA